jgi:subfamily B ATP-binding cassette protein MsbA
MKLYFRILAYASAYWLRLPAYLIATVLGIVFGTLNFTMLIPLFDVLFQTQPVSTIPEQPAFSLTVEYLTGLFNYYFSLVMLKYGKLAALQYICALTAASVFLANLFRYLAFRITNLVRAEILTNLRSDLFDKITAMHLGYFSNERKGDLMARLSTDVQEIENSVLHSIKVLIKEPATVIFYFIMLFYLSAKLTFFTLIFLPVSGLIISRISKSLRREGTESQLILGNILGIIDEALGGMKVVMAFNARPYVQGKFEEKNQSYRRLFNSIQNRKDLASPTSEFMGVLVVTGLLLFGGSMVLSGESELKASAFITYIVFFSQILTPAKSITSTLSDMQRGLAAAQRVFELADMRPSVSSPPNAVKVKNFEKNIELENVTFAYGERTVLYNVSLRVEKGKTVALVGMSGGGKSTIADLIPRFYDVQNGRVLFDDQDVRQLDLESLRHLVGIVSQEAVLFNDTIFNNIAFGRPDATEAEVIQAAKIAHAHDFILQTENGYQTNIGDRGTKLSGGQRQRLNIARAVLKNPPIMILDEATSALDSESERLVQDALLNLMKNRTSVVIAHRLSTIQHADEIVVMQEGRIAERGTHEQLMAAESGLYRRLIQLQAL